MEAAPSAPFEMPEPDLLLEFLIVALDAPAQLGDVDQPAEGNVFRNCRASQYLVGSSSPSGHSISSHSSGRLSVSFSSRCAGRTRRQAKREASGAAVPSR